MKTRQSRRQTAKVSHTRWLAYATASAATALAGSNCAEAAIHYSGLLYEHFPPHKDKLQRFPLDPAQAGDYFWFEHINVFNIAAFSVHGVGGFLGGYFRGFATVSQCEAFVSRLSRGQYISAGNFFHGGLTCSFGFPNGMLVSHYSGIYSQWKDPGIGFVGFNFHSGAGFQYGWARVRMSNTPENAFTVIDYAYADLGEPIRAGQKSSNEMVPEENDDMIPEEGSLGALALGAAGLVAWRKRRSQAAR